MPDLDGGLAHRLSLVDAVDRLLDKGAVLTGETVLSLAGVDLVYLGLNVIVASVETLRKDEGRRMKDEGGPTPRQPSSFIPHPSGAGRLGGAALPPSSSRLYPDTRTHGAESSPPEPAPAIVPLTGLPERLAADADDRPERGLARLVLTLIELLRQILERQALRRAEGTGLSEDEVERMGVALMELEAKMAELRDAFGLSEEDLNLDLGPLGRLL
jgi:hypothetical protein